MIIVNADDWGRSVAETDAALRCHAARRITSVTAMVFMEDSERAARLATEHGLDVGLHLNLSQPFTAAGLPMELVQRQTRICRFINSSKYALLLYNPRLRNDFAETYRAQLNEFRRLYGRAPTHVDGHHHKHLCANVLLDEVIPAGQKVRRSFFFWRGEKGRLNRSYRWLVDHLVDRKFRSTDYFFALSQCMQGDRLDRVVELAKDHTVEMMTHPASPQERDCLMSDRYRIHLESVERGSYSAL